MKIWGEIPKVTEIYGKQKSVGKVVKTHPAVSKEDVVAISNNAKDFQTAMKYIKEIPDIRQDKVNELIERYESGNYNVKGREIAERIVRSVFDKKA
ncbi:flagellar biosynthesis protein FlgM [Clostridium thermosuccinogenes]|jgi:negative regulator of flagellin synthesis FlgM|uniref:Flagellar biosynthesis protein FlgM n=1 Tax=Clostridium thermosuccinogenes TaxID=84032 RepID=A0A2K2FQE7_9CLOT|nr:flagellar biosynthesis anti-sigma factor FlgM [Pseudoclostridium thermosuccinogenes]AUS95082.1 flagellar biosynthesis protein FlgM [Pseudoclostridium thermosuccinogenes]PNT91453.1 flagellar biosynthesis protein FlgM [Pseudoclostridium thermosuccinogenes]PNT99198.1 flagellar biosynthesis protein FlgM [Pseudoclostridium thermosuccinogenes]PNU01001.1 flagellar biosynthesis protein FlgM [Pseudoclostridium thermosuccinogenes]